MSKPKAPPVLQNKRAEYEYFLIERFSAGMVLTGTEVKSLREGKANLSDAYCVFEKEELFVRHIHISEYKYGSYMNHEPKRARKLLLKKTELKKLLNKVKEKGLTIIPVKLYFDERGFAKLDIALAKGKKTYDKRESIKEKDIKRNNLRGED